MYQMRKITIASYEQKKFLMKKKKSLGPWSSNA